MQAKQHTGRRFYRGMAIAQTAMITTVIGGAVAAIAIDTGLMYNARAELQTVADAAALAAAAELGGSGDVQAAARAMAASYADKNAVSGNGLTIDPANDVVFGKAVLNTTTSKYTFSPNQTPYDSLQVTARRSATAADGPVQLLFGKLVGKQSAAVSATAVAMLVPRDIAVSIDLSGSMNDDSELRHYKSFPSESDPTLYRPGVQVNTKDIWTSLPESDGKNGILNGASPSSPGSASANANQPANGSSNPKVVGGHPDTGSEPSGGSSNPKGPRWGWMTAWGSALTLDVYTATSDWGQYYIPQYVTTTDSDVIENLTTSGYSSSERSALVSSANDSNATYYRNRVRVMLGLAGWKSGKSGGKYTGTGNGDNKVDSSELTQAVAYPYGGGSWDDYIKYASSSTSEMAQTDGNLRYRFGLKSVVNYFLEKYSSNSDTPKLASTPEQPLQAVKDAVQAMTDTIESMQSLDQMSLEVFAQTGRHEVNLSTSLQGVPSRLHQMQSNHYDSVTNIGGGLDKAITELRSSRARGAAAKVIVLMTDGKPNVDSSNNYVGDGASSAVNWCTNRATLAASYNMTIYTVGVGSDCDTNICQQIASIGKGQFYYAGGTPDEYMPEILEIFETLGGKRPVQLIK